MLQEKLLRAILPHKTLPHQFNRLGQSANLVFTTRFDGVMPIALSHASNMTFHLDKRAREVAS
ncbi:hypothetical protein D3C86_2236980 [compost metagenome]